MAQLVSYDYGTVPLPAVFDLHTMASGRLTTAAYLLMYMQQGQTTFGRFQVAYLPYTMVRHSRKLYSANSKACLSARQCYIWPQCCFVSLS